MSFKEFPGDRVLVFFDDCEGLVSAMTESLLSQFKLFLYLERDRKLEIALATTARKHDPSVGYAPYEPAKLKNLNELSRQSNGTERACKSAQDVSAQFGNVADEIAKQYVVVFRSSILGEGKEKTFQVYDESGGRLVQSNNITKLCVDSVPPPQPTRWWVWALLVGLPLCAIVGIVIWRLRRREDGMAIESPLEEPMMAPTPSEGSGRTMALDIGIPGRGPTVGWIVGVSGQHVDQTFKLKAGGRTLIGTAADADIVIDDQFMSGKHCEVRYDGNTYRIVDLGSTNGVVLNDKRVIEHDLVDGDTLRLGRTEFRFKSIN